MKRIALVTGGNRGLGYETAKQLGRNNHVILAARDSKMGEQAAARLRDQGLDVEFRPLDVTSSQSIRALVSELKQVDILVNNAGILLSERDPEAIRRSLETNVLGAYQLIEALAPKMRERKFGRIVNVSSGMGQLSEMNGGWPAYRISKTALNAVTRIFADELEGTGVLVNSVCPGWVKTDMGGSGAELPVEKGADTIVWLATLPDGGPSGGFFREREPIAW